MSETLSTITAKKNDFATRLMDGGTVSIGSNGTLITLTPPSGQRVRLTHLSTTAGSGFQEIGVTVLFGSTVVVNHNINGSVPSANGYSVGSYQPYAAAAPPQRNYTHWTGAEDEVLTVVKNTGNTVYEIFYGYQFGE